MSTADLDPAIYMRPRQMAFGLGWAARRSLLARHGFYDALVVGSGDRALSCAAYGRPDNAIVVTRMNPRQTAHYLRWAEPFYGDVRGNVGCVEGRLYHLWHGDPKNRRYRERHEAFSAYAFDPSVDIVVNSSGAYRLGGRSPRLAEFAGRISSRGSGCGLRELSSSGRTFAAHRHIGRGSAIHLRSWSVHFRPRTPVAASVRRRIGRSRSPLPPPRRSARAPADPVRPRASAANAAGRDALKFVYGENCLLFFTYCCR